MLKSNNMARYAAEKEHYFGQVAKYVGNNTDDISVLYATYPRSGNSLMRKYFENITGISTGSD